MRRRVVVPYCEVLVGHAYLPALEDTVFLLAAEFAEEILVPAPVGAAADRFREALAALPAPLARRVRVVDKHATMWRRVQTFAEPLDVPGGLGVFGDEYAESALYLLALAGANGAAVFGHSLSQAEVQFGTGVGVERLTPEGRLRFLQVAGLLLAYRRVAAPSIAFPRSESAHATAALVEELLDDARHQSLARLHGRLGLFRDPGLVLRSIRRGVHGLLESPRFRRRLQASQHVAALAGVRFPADTLREVAGSLEGGGRFAPPVLEHPTLPDVLAGRAARRAGVPPLGVPVVNRLPGVMRWPEMPAEGLSAEDRRALRQNLLRIVREGAAPLRGN